MNFTEKELEKKYKRKKALMSVIKEIENNGIKIDYNKYPKYKNMETLRKIILDYQLLVPGEEPDLTEMTNAVDGIVDASESDEGIEAVKKALDEMEEGTEVAEPEMEEIVIGKFQPEKIIEELERKEEEEQKPFKPDWDKINAIDVVDLSKDEGRKNMVRKIYLEMLGREPDAKGLEIYKQHIRDGLGISHIRDAIRRSKEYKRLHNL